MYDTIRQKKLFIQQYILLPQGLLYITFVGFDIFSSLLDSIRKNSI